MFKSQQRNQRHKIILPHYQNSKIMFSGLLIRDFYEIQKLGQVQNNMGI